MPHLRNKRTLALIQLALATIAIAAFSACTSSPTDARRLQDGPDSSSCLSGYTVMDGKVVCN